MNKVILICFLFLPILVFSQFSTPKIFGEIGGFYEDEFDPKPHTYLKLSAGVELFSYKFIAPEVDVSYYKGGDKDVRTELDDLGTDTYKSLLYRDASAIIWGFAPKLFLGDEEFRLVLIPKYSFGSITGTGTFIDSDYNEIERIAKANIHFWTFAFGIEGNGWSDSTKCGIYLIYTGFNAGKALNKLDFANEGYNQSRYNTKAIGLSFRISYNFKKKAQITK